MTIKLKVIVLFFGMIAVFLGLIVVLFEYFLLAEVNVLEQRRAEVEIGIVQHELLEAVEILERTATDYASWDDTYAYMEEPDAAYISSNYSDITFTNNELDIVLLVGASGDLVFSRGYDFSRETFADVPPAFVAHFATGSAILAETPDEAHSGILMNGETPVMFASRPILTSMLEGPSRGTLVMARRLNAADLTRIGQANSLSMELIPFTDGQIANPRYAPVTQRLSGDQTLTSDLHDDEVSGYSLLSDVYGQPAFLIRGTLPRQFYLKTLEAVQQYIVFISIFAVILTGVVYLVFKRLVMNRLTNVTDEVIALGRDADFTRRIKVTGKDELTTFAASVNKVLEALNDSQQSTREKSAQLAEKVKEIERQNDDLQRTKRAMLNVLEDERLLKDQLILQRDQAQAILSSVGDGLAVVDTNGVVELVNPAAEQLLEIKQSDVVRKPWQELVALLKDNEPVPNEARLWYQAVTSKNTLSGGLEANYSYRLPSGKTIPVSIVVTPLVLNETVHGAVISFRDVTQEKQQQTIIEQKVIERTAELMEKNTALEQARAQISEGWLLLQREKARLTSSIQSIPVGFILTDMQDNILLVNPAAMRILGFTAVPQHFREIEERLKGFCDLHAALVSSRENKAGIQMKNVAYNERHLDLFLTPIFIAMDNMDYIGSAMLINDITEAKIAERSKDEFFSIASHELRTPLTAIRGNTSMILQYFSDEIKDPSFREMVVDVHASSVRLIELVNDFLDVSRLEQRRFVFHEEEFAIGAQIASVVHDLQQVAGEKHIEVKALEIDPALTVKADLNRTKQVLFNLVGNAIKFTEHGSVTVGVEVQDRMVEISITDTGAGIPPAGQLLLFRKFQQAGESLYTRDTTRGTGLGLYISKLMVEGMHGTIRLVRSEAGKGSVFAFTLPKAG